MSRKIILKTALIVITVIAILFTAAFIMSRGSYTVPSTVETDKTIPRIELNGTVFHAELFGRDKAPLVIVLHGGPGGDYRYLLPLKELADQYRVLFYDQRGSGLSSRSNRQEPTLDSSLADLDAMVHHFNGGSKVNLIGHSWGAMLASIYTGRYPGKVDHLVLAEPGFLTPEMARVFLGKTKPSLSMQSLKFMVRTWLASLHVEGPDSQARRDFIMGQFMTAYQGSDHPLRGYFCGEVQSGESRQAWRFGYGAMKGILRSGMDEGGNFIIDFTAGLGDFKRKVLFLAGECNTITGRDHQLHHMTHFPWAELVEIRGAGHYMITENPVESIAVIRQYLGRNR